LIRVACRLATVLLAAASTRGFSASSPPDADAEWREGRLPASLTQGEPVKGGTLVVRIDQEPPSLDGITDSALAIIWMLERKVIESMAQLDAKKHPDYPLEPALATGWEISPDQLTFTFHLRHGVRWQNRPPVNGRELTADDVKFTYDRFLTEKGNPLRFMLDPVDRVEVVDRYTVRFRLKEPFVWLLHMLANPTGTWIVAREVVEKFGDLRRAEAAIGTGAFILERYEPNVKTVFKRNPDYFGRASLGWTGSTGS